MTDELMIEKLISLPEKEITALLSKNYVGKGSYVVYNNSIGKVLYRAKEKFLVDFGNSMNFLDDYRIDKLTPELFSNIKESYIKKKLFPKTPEAVKKLINSAVSTIYSEDRYDITCYNNYVYLIIHYPEIVITNSLNESHIIRDLFLKIIFYVKFSSQNIYIDYLGIARTTFSHTDILDGFYIFSHLHKTNRPKEYNTNLCFGYTDLSKTIRTYKYKMSFSDIPSLLLNMENYFSWESLEGVPYVKINQHLNRQGDTDNTTFDEDIISYYYKGIIQTIDNINFFFTTNNYGDKVNIDISSTNIIEDMLTNMAYTEHLYPSINGIAVYNSGWGEYEEKLVNEYNNAESEVTFKGETKKISINKFPSDNFKTLDELPKRIHHNIVKEVINRIETNFYKYLSLNYE